VRNVRCQTPNVTRVERGRRRDIARERVEHELRTIELDGDTSEIVRLVEDGTLRRVPVMDEDRPVGIVAIGDLAQLLDAESALGKISAAPPDA
jgi:CBS domain-containing protein